MGVYMLERRAAAVAVKLASPPPPPAPPPSPFSSLLSFIHSPPATSDPHVDRIRSDRAFYGWLERRFADYAQGVLGLQVRAPPAAALHSILVFSSGRLHWKCRNSCNPCTWLMLLQAPGGTASIWAASDVRVLGEAEGREDAAI